jgi:hypothetical protein
VADYSPRERYLQALLDHVVDDHYPSITQMDHLEGMLDREQLAAYLDVLIEKIERDRFPSVPMMKRIEQVLDRLG